MLLQLLVVVVVANAAASALEEHDAKANVNASNGESENETTTTTTAVEYDPEDTALLLGPSTSIFAEGCAWQARQRTDNGLPLVAGRYVDLSSDGMTVAVGGIDSDGDSSNSSNYIQLYQYQEETKTIEGRYIRPRWNNVTRLSLASGPFRMDLSNDGKKLVVLHQNSGNIDLYEYVQSPPPPSEAIMNNHQTSSFGSWEKKQQAQLVLSSEPSSISFVASHTSSATNNTSSQADADADYHLAVGLAKEGKVELYGYYSDDDRFSLRDKLTGGFYRQGTLVEGCFGHSVAQSRDGKVLAIGCP